MTVVNYLTIPGVIHHELSHAALALLTGAIVTEFKPFWPDKTSGSLGHVNFSTRGSLFTRCLQCTFTSTAPVILGTLSSILLFAYAANNTVPFYILVPMIYLIFSIIIHASMSFADVKIMLKGIWALFIAAYIICLYFQIDFLNVIRLHLIAQL